MKNAISNRKTGHDEEYEPLSPDEIVFIGIHENGLRNWPSDKFEFIS